MVSMKLHGRMYVLSPAWKDVLYCADYVEYRNLHIITSPFPQSLWMYLNKLYALPPRNAPDFDCFTM